LVGIDDSILSIMAIRILHDDDCATVLYLVLFERILVINRNFYVLTEESHIMLSEVLVLVIVLFLQQLLLELVSPDPGEKLHLELATLIDHVLKVEFNLFYYVFGVRL
jgi:hypothetical protein